MDSPMDTDNSSNEFGGARRDKPADEGEYGATHGPDVEENKESEDYYTKILGNNPKRAKAFRQYRQLLQLNTELCERMGQDVETVPVTRIVLLGIQSAGKTSVLNVLIKCYAGFTTMDTGNRCLVYYTLKHIPGQRKTKFYVDDHETHNLGESLKAVSEDIAATSDTGFRKKPAYVRIEGAQVLDLVVIDSMGLCPENREKNRIIKDILKPVIKAPENVFMIICKESEGDVGDTEQTRGAINSMFQAEGVNDPRWHKRAYFIRTAIDIKLPHWEMDDFTRHRKKVQKRYFNTPNILFISANPENKNLKDTKGHVFPDWASKNRYIEKIPLKEKHMWDEFADRTNLSEDDRKYVGVDKLVHCFAKIILTTMAKNGNKVLPKMNKIRLQYQDELHTSKELLRTCDPLRLRRLLDDYANEYNNLWYVFNESRPHASRELSVRQCGKKWAEFCALLKEDDTPLWEHYLKPQELKKKLSENGQMLLREFIDLKMKGQTAVKTAIDVFAFMLVAAPIRVPNLEEIMDAARPETTTGWDYEACVQKLTANSLAHVKAGQAWLGAILKVIYDHTADTVWEYLLSRPKYATLRESGALRQMADQISRMKAKEISARCVREFCATGEKNYRDRCAVLNIDFADNMQLVSKSFWLPVNAQSTPPPPAVMRGQAPDQDDPDQDESKSGEIESQLETTMSTTVRSLGFFKKSEKISTQFLSMLPENDRERKRPSFSIKSVLTATFRNYRCYIFSLKEEILMIAYHRVMRMLSSKSELDPMRKGIGGYSLDQHTTLAIETLCETYGIDKDTLQLHLELEAKKQNRESLNDMTLDQLGAQAGLDLIGKRRRVKEADRKLQDFEDYMRKKKAVLDEFRYNVAD